MPPKGQSKKTKLPAPRAELTENNLRAALQEQRPSATTQERPLTQQTLPFAGIVTRDEQWREYINNDLAAEELPSDHSNSQSVAGGDKSSEVADIGTDDHENPLYGPSNVHSCGISGDNLDLSLVGAGWEKGQRYTKRSLTSHIWIYGHWLQQKSDPKHVNWWLCKFCHEKRLNPFLKKQKHLYNAQTSSNASEHLLLKHRIDENGPMGPIKNSIADQIQVSAARGLAARVNSDEFNGKFMTWVLLDNITFRQSTSRNLHELLKLLNPKVDAELWTSHNTTRNHIVKLFDLHKITVSRVLAAAKSRISISFDGWQANTGANFVGVCAHFIDSEYRFRTILIGMPAIKGEKTGKNQAEVVNSVLKMYNLTSSNIGWFVLDNASTNDVSVKELAMLYGFDHQERRLRCTGHSTQLSENITDTANPYTFDSH
jgi:hypothetical protein